MASVRQFMELAVYNAGAGAAGGTGTVLILLHPGFVQLAGVVAAHRLKHVAEAGAPAVVQGAGQHGAAGDKDGGHVHPGGRHEQAGDVLIAIGDHHQAVELVGQGHSLGGVGDQVPGDQGVLHAHVAHGDAVAHGDGGELHRSASGGPDAGLDRLGNLVQVHVAGDNLVVGADHPDHRPLQLLLGVAQGVEQRAVRRGGYALLHNIRAHCIYLLNGYLFSCLLSECHNMPDMSRGNLLNRGHKVRHAVQGRQKFRSLL